MSNPGATNAESASSEQGRAEAAWLRNKMPGCRLDARAFSLSIGAPPPVPLMRVRQDVDRLNRIGPGKAGMRVLIACRCLCYLELTL